MTDDRTVEARSYLSPEGRIADVESDMCKSDRSGREQENPVASDVYDQTYFLAECEGYESFLRTDAKLSRRLAEALRRIKIDPGMKVLDVGCGRGEIVHATWKQGAICYGIDYAALPHPDTP